jgi:hypothetical protein
VIKVVADEKGLSNAKRESATMYVEDLAEFARVLLTTGAHGIDETGREGGQLEGELRVELL